MTARVITFCLVALAAVLCTVNPDLFVYSREGLVSGEVWRLMTGHLVHFTAEHLLANITALALLLGLLPRLNHKLVVWLSVFTPLLLAGSLYFIRPELAFYGGLSGWLSALFVFAVAHYSRRSGAVGTLSRISIVLFLAKLAFEVSSGKPILARFEDGIVVEGAAHVLGAALGIIAILFAAPLRWDQRVQQRCSSETNKKGGPFRNRLTFFGVALHRPQINSLKAIRRNDR